MGVGVGVGVFVAVAVAVAVAVFVGVLVAVAVRVGVLVAVGPPGVWVGSGVAGRGVLVARGVKVGRGVFVGRGVRVGAGAAFTGAPPPERIDGKATKAATTRSATRTISVRAIGRCRSTPSTGVCG